MVSFCACGLGFFGESVKAADDKLAAHIQAVFARRQQLGELLAGRESASVNMGRLLGWLARREQER